MRQPSKDQLFSFIVKIGVIFAIAGVFLPGMIVTPEITVTDVQFEPNAPIQETDVTYFSALSEEEQRALERGEPNDELADYVDNAYQNYATGKVITSSGMYVIEAQTDYGPYNPIVKYKMFGFIPGMFYMIYILVVGNGLVPNREL